MLKTRSPSESTKNNQVQKKRRLSFKEIIINEECEQVEQEIIKNTNDIIKFRDEELQELNSFYLQYEQNIQVEGQQGLNKIVKEINNLNDKENKTKQQSNKIETKKNQYINNQTNEKLKFLMVSGQPGSGKTMLLQKCCDQWTKRGSKTIYINAMTCKTYFEFLTKVGEYLNIKKKINLQQLKQELQKKLQSYFVIIVVDEFEQLFKVSEQQAFDLFQISKNALVIGISNDIEFLPKVSAKYQFKIPEEIKNIVLKPYTTIELQELILDRLQNEDITFDKNAIKLLATKAHNDKGGDMRNIIDIIQRTLRDKNNVISQENLIMQTNDLETQMNQMIETFPLHQKIVLLAIVLQLKKQGNQQQELDQADVIRKTNEIQYKLSLNMCIDVNEELNGLKDYNILQIKEVKQQKQGIRLTVKKIICKMSAIQIEQALNQSLTSYYKPSGVSKLRKVTLKQGEYRVYSFSRTYQKQKKSLSFKQNKPSVGETRLLDQSCCCNECGGKVAKNLIVNRERRSLHQVEQLSILKLGDCQKTPKSYEIMINSSHKPSIHTPNSNKFMRNKCFKPMTRVLQMVHVKALLSSHQVISTSTKQNYFQSSSNTVTDFHSKQFLQVPESKDLQSPTLNMRLRTEPQSGIGGIHLNLVKDTKKFYYPRVSRISQMSISNLMNMLNSTDGFEKKSKKLQPLTSRVKSPNELQTQKRTLSQRLNCTYLRKNDSRPKERINKL